MVSTSRELVYHALSFSDPQRAPRFLFVLPWAWMHYPDEYREIREMYPDDFAFADYEGLVTYGCFQIRPADPYGNPGRSESFAMSAAARSRIDSAV